VTSHTDQIKAEELPAWLEWLPDMPFDEIARHSMDFWLQAEDLPHPDNRVYYKDGKVHLVTDASFFPSIGAVNPTLTIVANALRVADIIKTRW